MFSVLERGEERKGERREGREKRREDRGVRRKGTGKMLRGETVASFLGPPPSFPSHAGRAWE